MDFMTFNQMRSFVMKAAGRYYSLGKLVVEIESSPNKQAALLTCLFAFSDPDSVKDEQFKRLGELFFLHYQQELERLLACNLQRHTEEKLIVKNADLFIESTAKLVKENAIEPSSTRDLVSVIKTTCILPYQESTIRNKLLLHRK